MPPLGGFKNLTPYLPRISRDAGIQTINDAAFNGEAANPSDFIFASGASLRHIITTQSNKVVDSYCLAGGESKDPTSPYFANMSSN